MRELYLQQAKLLVELLPHVAGEPSLALKGGAAINMFVRDLPRISVDIDLTYVPVAARPASLEGISRALRSIASRMKRILTGIEVREKCSEGFARTLYVSRGSVVVKLEPNTILRGTLLPSQPRTLSTAVNVKLGTESHVLAATLSFDELYAGKICAALDRQHPRDLFDIWLLLSNEGLTEGVRRAFVVYLAASDRPMHELLAPQAKPLPPASVSELAGMTDVGVSVDDLTVAWESLVRQIREGLSPNERRFLLSLKHGEPEWDLLGFPDLERLPALQWKLTNIRRMAPGKRADAEAKLKAVLGL